MTDNNLINDNEPELLTMPIPNPFFGFIFNYWKFCLIGLLVLAFGATYFIQKLRIQHYKNLYDKAEIEVIRLKDNVETLKKTLEDQNDKIGEAAEVGKKHQEQIDDLSKQIKDKEKNNKIVIDEMKKQPAPNGCQESLDYINKIVDGVIWKN